MEDYNINESFLNKSPNNFILNTLQIIIPVSTIFGLFILIILII